MGTNKMVAIDSTLTTQIPSGWMAVEKCQPSNHEAKEKLVQLFTESKTHRFSEERLAWLVMWTGSDIYDPLDKHSTHNFNTRLNFLKSCWDNVELFRPFDTVQTSAKHLLSTPRAHFLVRLSTTVPGSITISFRSENTIKHTRFTLNTAGEIQDGQGNKHSSLLSLSNWFSLNRLRTQQTYMPA